MTLSKRIAVAIIEAERFIDKAVAWKKRLEADESVRFSGSKEGGTCKRSSLDLARALAELRKGHLG